MDEYHRHNEPNLRRYFRKIVNSFVVGFTWIFLVVTAGMYFELGYLHDGIHWYTILFYLLAAVSFVWMIRYYYRTWKG